MELLDPDSVHGELAVLVAGLDQAEELVVVEAQAGSLLIWRIRRDQTGTPQALYQSRPWADFTLDGLTSGAEFQRLAGEGEIPFAFCPPVAEIPDSSGQRQFLDWFRAAYPAAILVETHVPVDDLMRKALTAVPLSEWYELVVAEPSPAGRLRLSTVPLFPPGGRKGDARRFSVHCDTGTEYGISFAVVARDDTFAFRLVSVESARVPPGRYELTAVLLRPGRVRIEGLPERLNPDRRSWTEILATIPDRITHASREIHLICLVEACGPPEEIRRRAERAVNLVELAAGESVGRVVVSLVSYGGHSFERTARDGPVAILTWAAPPDQARLAFGDLFDQEPGYREYPRAARLECALTEVAARVTGHEGRPVLVAIGSRPPFPHRVDPVTEILPCPNRNDWRWALVRLGEQDGVSLGAITDNDSSEAWRLLGSDAHARPDVVDMVSFAKNLGLLSQETVPVPLPLANSPERAHARQ